MQLDKLKQLYTDCRKNENYKYKDLPDDIFLEKSQKSFKRLPVFQQEKVMKSWKKLLETNKIEINKESVEDCLKYRFLAQTNLYFLGHLLEKYNQMTVNTHEEICNEFFVQKDPEFTTFEEFANSYTDLKERLLLSPTRRL